MDNAEFFACMNFILSKVLVKTAGRDRMWENAKDICSSKCMAFSVSALSHALVTLNFKHRKRTNIGTALILAPPRKQGNFIRSSSKCR